MLRCIRFATRFNFLIEDETFEALERNAERIKIISGERIADELNKILMTKHPSRGFVDLQRSGLLAIIFPELSQMDMVETKNGRAHKNNFYHTLEVLENLITQPPTLNLLRQAQMKPPSVLRLPLYGRGRGERPLSGFVGRLFSTISANRRVSAGTLFKAGLFMPTT
jgi:tRNA nucleotidyltransferase/poly(A) polymerase